MDFLQRATVSRKTPRDGKLEITSETASRLGVPGETLRIQLNDVEAAGSLATMPCGCKGETSHVVHYFLDSDSFRTLIPESELSIELDPDSPGVVRVTAVTAEA